MAAISEGFFSGGVVQGLFSAVALAGALGVGMGEALAQPSGADPTICAEWETKLKDGISQFPNFQTLAGAMGTAAPIPEKVSLNSSAFVSAQTCLDKIIQPSANLHDSAEFATLRFRLPTWRQNPEAVAYAGIVVKMEKSPTDSTPIVYKRPEDAPARQPKVIDHLEKTIQNAQDKNRLFFFLGLGIGLGTTVLVVAGRSMKRGVRWLVRKITPRKPEETPKTGAAK